MARMNVSADPRYLTVPRLSRIPGLIHGFGTRHWTLADFKKHKEWKNFKIVWLKQIHSNAIRFIENLPRRRLQGDALATDRPGIFLILKTADCLPVFLVDESRRVVAAVHCGWRGTRQRILEGAVRGLRERYGCEPASLLAVFGPGIGPSCYEVGEDVRQDFQKACLPEDVFRPGHGQPGKLLLDLPEANRRQLIGQGVRLENVVENDICTHCDGRFLSFRRDRNKTARLTNFIGLAF